MMSFSLPQPAARTLRQFAVLWLLFMGVVAYRSAVTWGTLTGITMLAIAVVPATAGFIWPATVRPLFIALMVVTMPIGWAVSHLLLFFLFYVLFTPIAIAFRLLGRDALERSFRPEVDSYWEPKITPANPARYLDSF